ncbi:MAG: nickel-responsive transcriptional regulator NikR [Methanomethylovorans sp.]|uniref:nickel-responsive transcriptional regulator NikR n=1 Tax=Methanomethylovorans sp. TaxID=2758717 RepID=UPI003531246B
MEQELMRIGVSLPDNLLTKFDSIIDQRGYSSRSEGIRDAIRSYITHYEWMNDVKGRRVATITLIYEYMKRGLSSSLTEIQHDNSSLIKSSIITHLDNDNCLEVIVLDGERQDVRSMTEKLMSLKGVKYVKLNTAHPPEATTQILEEV